MAALALGLSASICWGCADFLGGLETRRLPGLLVVLLSQAFGLVALGTVALLAGELTTSPDDFAVVAIAGVSGAVGITAFYQALAIGTMSVVAPITATGAIVPVIIGLGGGDHPGGLQMVGMAIGAVGILLSTQDGEDDAARRRLSRISIGLALIAAVSIGSGLAAFDRAADSGVLGAVVWARVVSVSALLIVVACVRPRTQGVRPHLKGIALIGVLDVGATTLYTLSTTEGFLSVVAVMASLYPVVTVVLARILLREEVRSVQAAGIVFALSGVTLVAAGG